MDSWLWFTSDVLKWFLYVTYYYSDLQIKTVRSVFFPIRLTTFKKVDSAWCDWGLEETVTVGKIWSVSVLTEVPPKAEPETGEQEWGSEKRRVKTVQGSLF